MKASKLFLGVLILFGAIAVAFAQGAGVVRPDEIGKDQLGKKVEVEGRVYSTAQTGVGVHLYFGADTTTAFQGLVPTKSLYKFHVDVAKKYARRNVRITGKVEEESGKFFIRIEDPGQIKVVQRKTS